MTSTEHTRPAGTDGNTSAAERPDGFPQLMGFSVRIAGQVPTRVDLQHAGTPECQLGLSLGTVLVYLRSHYTAQIIAGSWASAAPVAASLVPQLPGRRRGAVLSSGPWSVAAMVRMSGTPSITGGLIPGRPGSEVPAILRLRVGPITWDLCDAAAYTTTLAAWKTAAALLAAVDEIERS